MPDWAAMHRLAAHQPIIDRSAAFRINEGEELPYCGYWPIWRDIYCATIAAGAMDQ